MILFHILQHKIYQRFLKSQSKIFNQFKLFRFNVYYKHLCDKYYTCNYSFICLLVEYHYLTFIHIYTDIEQVY